MGKVQFVCQSIPGGIPYLHPIIILLVLCSFWGVPGGSTPAQPRTGLEYHPPPSQDSKPPSHRLQVTPGQVMARMVRLFRFSAEELPCYPTVQFFHKSLPRCHSVVLFRTNAVYFLPLTPLFRILASVDISETFSICVLVDS